MESPRWRRPIDDLGAELSALKSAWQALIRLPLRAEKLDKFGRALINAVDNRGGITLFVMAGVVGFATSIVTSNPPILAVLAFALIALVGATGFGIQGVARLWRREIPMALWLGIWAGLLGWLFMISVTALSKWVV